MKELFEQVIQRKDYDLKSLLTCIDQYHIEGKLPGASEGEGWKRLQECVGCGRETAARNIRCARLGMEGSGRI